MAATPKKKSTKARQGKRRAASQNISLPNVVLCPACKKLKRTHQVCPHCGAYKKL